MNRSGHPGAAVPALAAGGSPAATLAVNRHGGGSSRSDPADGAHLEQIIERLRESTGVDFGAYRRGTVERRIRNRMISSQSAGLADYCRRLQADPAEAGRLLQSITIKVSRFFRNDETFATLRDAVLPQLAAQAAGRPLAVWSAGCSHGEEPYSLALQLEALGIAGQVLATDIDAAALLRAASGRFDAEALAAVPEHWRRQYFAPDRGNPLQPGPLRADPLQGDPLQAGPLQADRRLSQRLRFERHDLTGPAAVDGGPFDLILCRNVLIYFERDAQLSTLRRLLAALRPGGFLCLGEAEWPLPELLPMLRAWPRRSRLFERLEDVATCAEL